MSFFPAGLQTYTLQSSVSSTQTTITLSSFKVPVSGDDVTMALMNTSVAYGTIAPRTNQSEFISFTGITQNADGTATLTGVTRGLDKTHPFTTNTDFKLPHAGASQFILSDAPGLFNEYSILRNDETVTGEKTFPTGGNANAPKSGSSYTAPTDPLEYASKQYVDNTATGTTNVDRVIVTATAGETVAVDQLVYLKVSDGRWWLADADTAATVENVVLGIAQGSGTAGNSISGGILTYGINTFSGITLTANTKYYASNTAGGFSSSAGTFEVTVGESQTTTTIFFNPRFDQQLTENQQDALAGTSGTPSASNLFVTNDDTATAATASKVARRLASGDVTVPTTPTNTTDAASKAYVDLGDSALTTTQQQSVNTLETQAAWFTWTAPVIVDASDVPVGWETTGTPVNSSSLDHGGAGYTVIGGTGGGGLIVATSVPGNGSSDKYTAASSKDIKVKNRVQFDTTPSAGNSIGFGFADATGTLDDDPTSTATNIRFVNQAGVLYAVNSNGTTNTATNISSGLTITSWNTYEIVFNPGTNILFYVNGAVKATHTTNLPTGSLQYFGYGTEVSDSMLVSPNVFSLEL